MTKFDGETFEVGGITGSIDEIESAHINEANIQFKGLAIIAQPFFGGDVAGLSIRLSDGRTAKARARDPREIQTMRRLAQVVSKKAAGRAKSRIDAGETVSFGALSLSQSELTIKKKVYSLEDITGYKLYQGTLMFDHKGVLSASVPFARIENAYALLELLDHVAPGLDFDRMPPSQVPTGSIMRPTAAHHDPRYLSGRARIAVLLAPVALMGVYFLAMLPFMFMHQSNMDAARVENRRVFRLAKENMPTARPDKPLATACRGKIDLAAGQLAGASSLQDVDDLHMIEIRERYAYGDHIPYNYTPDMTSSFSTILEQFPTDWGKATKKTYPHRDWNDLRYIVAAKELDWKSSSGTGDYAGTTELAVRILDTQGRETICEGHVVAQIKKRRWGDPRPGGVAAATLAPMCPWSKATACEDALGEVALVSPQTVAAEETLGLAAAPSTEKTAKVQTTKRRRKVKRKKRRKRRRRRR